MLEIACSFRFFFLLLLLFDIESLPFSALCLYPARSRPRSRLLAEELIFPSSIQYISSFAMDSLNVVSGPSAPYKSGSDQASIMSCEESAMCSSKPARTLPLSNCFTSHPTVLRRADTVQGGLKMLQERWKEQEAPGFDKMQSPPRRALSAKSSSTDDTGREDERSLQCKRCRK